MLRSLTLGLALVLTPLALRAQATTTCADGTTSPASGRGACSGHGGVKKAAAKAAKSTAKAESKAAKADVKADTKAAKTTARAETKVAAKSAKAESKTSASATDANGATAKCKDGTYSHAANRRGACSKHGGVADWLKS